MSRSIFCLVALAWIGCAEGPVVDHTRDPDMFALDVKEVTADSVAQARGSDEPAEELSGLVDMLADLRAQPTGEHLSLYQEIGALATEIYEEAQAVDGRPEDLEERLDQLWALAEQLPGDVDVEEYAEELDEEFDDA